MPSVINVETLQFFEDRLGKEEGRKVAEVLERAYEEMEKKAEALSIQRKLELKDELTKELATKEDIARLEGKMESEIARLEGKLEREITRLEGKLEREITRLEGIIKISISQLERKSTIMFVLLLFTMVVLNRNALEFILKVFGFIK